VKRKIEYPCSEEATVSLPGICSVLPVLLGGVPAFGCGKEQKAPPQVPIVEVVEVTQKDVPVYGEWVGTLDGSVQCDHSGTSPGLPHSSRTIRKAIS